MASIFPPTFGPLDSDPIMPGPPDSKMRIARVRLDEDWPACGSAAAKLLDWWPDDYDDRAAGGVYVHDDGVGVLCRDPAGLIEWSLAAMQGGSTGGWYIPAGWYCTVWRPEDAFDGHWEFLAAGKTCEGSSGSEESGSEESGSEESGSEESGSGECPCICADLVPADACWIGCDADKIVHLTPLDTKVPADCAVRWDPGANCPDATCGLSVDDAGHVIGWWDHTGAWYSPWNIPQPQLNK